MPRKPRKPQEPPKTANPEIKEGGSAREEMREKFLQTATAQPQNAKNPPMHLLVMLVILGVLAGIALMYAYFQGQGPQPPDNIPDQNANDLAYRTVPITMIYSNECVGCRQSNTIEELFKVRNIPYALRKIEAGTDKGKEIIEKFGIETLPTAIIDAKKIEFYPSTKKNFDAVLTKTGNAYIAPELNLDEKTYSPVYYTNRIPGLCAAGKPSITQFDDYYVPFYSFNRKKLYSFLQDLNNALGDNYLEEVEFNYSFAQSISRDENSALANLFLMCASEQGKYIELEKKMTGIYCNNPFKGDETVLTDPEIKGCWTLSNHYGTPLLPIELDIALGRTGIDMEKFVDCVKNRKNETLKRSQAKVEELGITRTGTFLIDCRETADIDGLKETFCARNPGICGKTRKTNSDTNSE